MSQPQSSKAQVPKNSRSTAAGTSASQMKAATGSGELTEAQLKAKEIGMDPRLVSNLANNLLQLDEMYQDKSTGKVYLVKNKQEVKGATASKAGIIRIKDGPPIGFINMPKTSRTDKLRKATYAAIDILKGKKANGPMEEDPKAPAQKRS